LKALGGSSDLFTQNEVWEEGAKNLKERSKRTLVNEAKKKKQEETLAGISQNDCRVALKKMDNVRDE